MLYVFNTHRCLNLCTKGKKQLDFNDSNLSVCNEFVFFCKICKNCEWVMIMDLWVTSDRKVFQFVHRLWFSWFTVAMCYISTLSYNFAFILLHFCHSLRWILQTTYEILNCVVCGKRKNCHFQLHTSRLAQNWICQISNKKRKWPVYYLRASTRSLHKVLRKFLMVLEELPSNFFFFYMADGVSSGNFIQRHYFQQSYELKAWKAINRTNRIRVGIFFLSSAIYS